MDIYFYDISRPFTKDEMTAIPSQRRDKASKYRFPKDRSLCLAAGFLLSCFLDVRDDNCLLYGETGKPFFKEEGSPFFNLSHSGQYAVLAVARHEIGIDIESVSSYTDSVAQKCFTCAEYEWLMQHSESERNLAFYKLWTAKESMMKAIGKGFYLNPASFSVLPDDNSPHVLENRTFFLSGYNIDEYIVCTAVEHQPEPMHVHFYPFCP